MRFIKIDDEYINVDHIVSISRDNLNEDESLIICSNGYKVYCECSVREVYKKIHIISTKLGAALY